MKVIVTGGAGFIGSCLLWQLNQMGIEDILVVDCLGESLKWRNLVKKKFKDYIEKDDFLSLIQQNKIARRDADVLVHLGACTSTTFSDAAYFVKNNYEYSKTLAQFCLSHNISFLYASSAATYGIGEQGFLDDEALLWRLTPLNIYGYSKHLFDLWALSNKLLDKITGFKFFNVFGPNEYHKGEMMSVIARSYDKIVKEKKIRLFKSYHKDYADGEQKRDFIYVKDVVRIIGHFMEYPDKKGLYNVGTGRAHTWNELARAVFLALNLPLRIEYFDMPEALRDKYQYYTQADIKKLNKAGAGDNFYDFQEAVKEYAGFLQTQAYL